VQNLCKAISANQKKTLGPTNKLFFQIDSEVPPPLQASYQRLLLDKTAQGNVHYVNGKRAKRLASALVLTSVITRTGVSKLSCQRAIHAITQHFEGQTSYILWFFRDILLSTNSTNFL